MKKQTKKPLDNQMSRKLFFGILAAGGALIAVLAAGLIISASDAGCRAAAPKNYAEEPAQTESDAIAYFYDLDWEVNPVDDFFSRYSLSAGTSSNADMTAYKTARSDIWLSELNHAYDLLVASINPELSEDDRKELEQEQRDALEHFLEYADTSAHTEAMTIFSNVFEVYDDYENLYGGSGLSGCYMQLLGDMYRQETLRVYAMIEDIYKWKNVTEAFVFDEEEFLAAATEKYDIILES